MTKIDPVELLLSGLESAHREGSVLTSQRRETEEYIDVEAESLLGDMSRSIFVRCYRSSKRLNSLDMQNVQDMSKRTKAHMTLVIGCVKGPLETAEFRGIGVLPYERVPNLPEDFWTDLWKPMLLAYGFRFRTKNRRREIAIPEEPALLAHLMKKLRVVGPAIDTNPEALVEKQARHCASQATSTSRTFSLTLPIQTSLLDPSTNSRIVVTSFLFEYCLVPIAGIQGKEDLDKDRYLLGDMLERELEKRNAEVDPSQIEIGFNTRLRSGEYYYNPKLQFSYYCESARKGRAKLVLLESYQGGRLVQARIEISNKSTGHFVEITNATELQRLADVYETFAISDKNLHGRFNVFAHRVEGSECIDELALSDEQAQARKADYFFNDRRVVAEFKSLQTDSSHKVNAILEPYRHTPEWPIFYAEQNLQTVLSYLPDPKEINTRIVDAVTDSIEAVIRSANQQIRATKQTFRLPHSGGLVVIFNELVDILSPDVVAYRVRKVLRKKQQSGEVCFPEITVVLIINAGHYTQLNPHLKASPILVMPSGLPDPNGIEEFATSLLPQWSAFDGRPLYKLKTEDFSRLRFTSFPEPNNAAQPMRRYEYWRMQYRQAPYLRKLHKWELLEYGARLFEDLAPRFLVGAPPTAETYMGHLMERFTHYLEETNFRAIDLRNLIPNWEEFRERLDRLYNEYNSSESTSG